MAETTGCSPISIFLFSHSNVIFILAHGHPDKDDISKPLLQLVVAMWLSSDQWNEHEYATWQLHFPEVITFPPLFSTLLLRIWMWQLELHLRPGVDLRYGGYISWNSRIEGAWVPEDSMEQSCHTSSTLPTPDVNLGEQEKFPSPLILLFCV